MSFIAIDKRFFGPPNSGNGGYVCGLLAKHFPGSAEITLRAPPPLERELHIETRADGAVELHAAEKLIAAGRPVQLDIQDIPPATYSAAEDAARRTPYDESNHNLPMCFVCGPARKHGDGLRIFAGPLRPEASDGLVAATWVPYANLADTSGYVAREFLWAALDCPTGYAGVGARQLGLNGSETILLGRPVRPAQRAAAAHRRDRPTPATPVHMAIVFPQMSAAAFPWGPSPHILTREMLAPEHLGMSLGVTANPCATLAH